MDDLEQLRESMDISGILPHVNQCEFHPFQNPRNLRLFCKENDIYFGVNINCLKYIGKRDLN